MLKYGCCYDFKTSLLIYAKCGQEEKRATLETRTGNRYQARSNFDVTSFRHHLISSSFSSSRSNCDIISFRSDMGTNGWTNGRTNQPTNGPTDQRTKIV
jgi:hypothetical protein